MAEFARFSSGRSSAILYVALAECDRFTHTAFAIEIVRLEPLARAKIIRMACEEGRAIQNECSLAVAERVAAEDRLGCLEDGPFSSRKERFELSKERWSRAILGRIEHIQGCPTCYASPPK